MRRSVFRNSLWVSLFLLFKKTEIVVAALNKINHQANFLPFFYENLRSFRFSLSVRLQNYASTIYHARSSTFPSTN
ncbi:hypothetical protein RclHR1_09960007 [Rhizophagus clarus]|uniref:Secreted protein n=1 Tax=Rhizophagus clarus TaxID=94130 RepID=A0A2Z6S6B1_9GLOM|nr:hypothetical protein RclHR1_09960007 [Rhizophagus clarus]GET02427.1 hypothetical protein RCL_jg21036.t1 [Rhizophagus clarus]